MSEGAPDDDDEETPPAEPPDADDTTTEADGVPADEESTDSEDDTADPSAEDTEAPDIDESASDPSADDDAMAAGQTDDGGPKDGDVAVAGESAAADSTSEADSAVPEESMTISGDAGEPTPATPQPAAGGAPDDQEMPLTAHIEEMIKRLAVVIVVMALISAVIFPLGDRLINFLWYSFLPGPPTECVQQAANAVTGTAADGAGSDTAACPRLYHPLALVLARLKVASLGGFIVALPVFVYQTYLFMRPGLYPNERRYYLASVPTSLILAGVGVAFAYFLVLPIIFQYFLGYSQPVAEVAFGLSETFGLILLMLGMFAVIFQIPLFIMLAIMMGVTTRAWLQDRRLYFWFGFAGIAFLFSPDPTGMAPFIVALTMVVLFEGSLLLLRWANR